jgi:hypothetical protein
MQIIIVNTDQTKFSRDVNAYLQDGAKVVPGTLVIAKSGPTVSPYVDDAGKFETTYAVVIET